MRAPAGWLALLVGASLAVACERGGELPARTPSSSAPTPPAAPATEGPAVVALAGETMGTTWHVKVVAPGAADTQRAPALQALVQKTLDDVNQRMSTWIPESEISRFNASRSTEPFAVSAATAKVVGDAKAIGEATAGAFDVTLGPLIDLWGFDKEGRRETPPTAAEVEAARARVGLDKLHVVDGALQKDRPDLEVNLSGIAKGYAVDEVARALEAEGVTDFMVEVGGEVVTRGKNAERQPWKLGVNVPKSDADPTAVLRTVSVSGRALATSGSYRNFFESGGRRYAHILDPRTGAPTDHNLVSATILGPDCTLADGLATAALVLGEERMRSVLAEHYPGVEALFVHAPRAGETGGLLVTKTAGFPDS